MAANSITKAQQTVRPKRAEQLLVTIEKFIRSQVVSSIFLVLAAVIAIIWANSSAAEGYFALWKTPTLIQIGNLRLEYTLHEWVNDGLMVLFFLLVGLEIKREILVGELSSFKQAALPIFAALGGMIFPAIIFSIFNYNTEAASGWGIPMATDIAFALGLLALLGKRVPLSLKIFLTTLAVADDLGGILVIALFYNQSVALNTLVIAGLLWLVMFTLDRLGMYNGIIFTLLGIGIWLGFVFSGVHATIAGVLIALAIPSRSLIAPEHFIKTLDKQHDELRDAEFEPRSVIAQEEQKAAVTELHHASTSMVPPLLRLEHDLQPWVSFVVLPIFALANAGVAIGSENLLQTLGNPITLGVAGGLILGKQIGISLFAWLSVKLGIARLPKGVKMRQIYAISWLGGIGFTVSLFITELAFAGNQHLADFAKIGIIGASILAGAVGVGLVYRATPPPKTETTQS